MILFITPCTITTGDYRQYSAIADLHILQFIVTHALGFSVLTNHILATDLSQSHCNFKTLMKSSSPSIVPFLPLFFNCHLNSIPSSSSGRLASPNRLYCRLDYCSILPYAAEKFFIITSHGLRRKHSIYC
jgi:hypothetical protein